MSEQETEQTLPRLRKTARPSMKAAMFHTDPDEYTWLDVEAERDLIFQFIDSVKAPSRDVTTMDFYNSLVDLQLYRYSLALKSSDGHPLKTQVVRDVITEIVNRINPALNASSIATCTNYYEFMAELKIFAHLYDIRQSEFNIHGPVMEADESPDSYAKRCFNFISKLESLEQVYLSILSNGLVRAGCLPVAKVAEFRSVMLRTTKSRCRMKPSIHNKALDAIKKCQCDKFRPRSAPHSFKKAPGAILAAAIDHTRTVGPQTPTIRMRNLRVAQQTKEIQSGRVTSTKSSGAKAPAAS